MPKRLRYL